jgi:hypothetical protein
MDTLGSLALAGNVAAAGHYNTGAANMGAARRVALSAGVYTWTFPAPYASTPVCSGTEENSSSSRQLVISSISTSSVKFTSTVTTGNTDTVDLVCFGNPN